MSLVFLYVVCNKHFYKPAKNQAWSRMVPEIMAKKRSRGQPTQQRHRRNSRELTVWKSYLSGRFSSKIYESNPTQDVITVLTDGYDVSYGARSVKHETERKVVSKLAKAFEDGTLKKDMKIVMCCDLPENVQGTI